MSRPSTDRNLLFGILALQMDFIGRDALIRAMNAWVLDKSKTIGTILVEQQALSAKHHTLLEAMVETHLQQHGNDAEQSLAAVSAMSTVAEIRDELKRIADPELDPTVADVGNVHPDGSEPTVGTSTSSGQRFRILRPHARGGLGQVSVAQDVELNREVAVKEIQEHHADDPYHRARFRLEAEINGGLEHPNIVPVYGVGSHDNGRPFYAMRLIRGDSLKDAIARFHQSDNTASGTGEPTLGLRELLRRFVDVCNAMAYAHSRGVLHRDLKPGNIMLGPYGETLVVDWGLAKSVDRPDLATAREGRLVPSLGSDSAPTRQGKALGTYEYMSPEQAAGRQDQPGVATDVYSLGATLYCLLTGQPAFAKSDDIVQRVQKGLFPPPRQVKKSVPPPLEAICLKAMARLREDRYATAKDLAEDVEHWLADEVVSAYREPASVWLGRWMKRNRTLVSSLGVLLLTAVVGLSVGLLLLGWEQARTEQQRQEAVKEKDRAEAQLARAEMAIYVNKILLAQGEWEHGTASIAWDHLQQCQANLRGWEYLYLLTQFNKNTFKGHTGFVNSVAISRDGKRIVSGSADNTLKVWDAATGREIHTLKGHTKPVLCVAFSPDDKRIVSGSQDRTLKIWDAHNGVAIYTLKGDTLEVTCVAFSPDGKRIVSGGKDNTIKLWDINKGIEIHTLKGHKHVVTGVAFSPDGKRVVSSSYDNTIKLWDADKGTATHSFSTETEWVYSVAFSPDGKRIVSGGSENTIKIRDADKGLEILSLNGHTQWVTSVAFSPDGKRIVSSSYDKTIKVWDADKGVETRTIKGHLLPVTSVVFSPDGKRIFSGSQDNTIKMWDADKVLETRSLKGHTNGVLSVAFSPDGKRCVSCSRDNTIKIWDVDKGLETLSLQGNKTGVTWVAFSPDGKRIVSGNQDNTITIWDADKGVKIHTLKGHTDTVACVAFSPDGKRILSGSRDTTLKLWDADKGIEIHTLEGHTQWVSGVAFSPDGKRIVSSSMDKTIKLWDADKGVEIQTLKGHTEWVSSVAFSPDGKRVVSGSYDNTLKVWDADSGIEIHTLKGHAGWVCSVVFSPDGKRIVSGSKDNTLKLWDADKGVETLCLKGHTNLILSVAFSPDGKHILSGGWDNIIKIWDADKGEQTPMRDPTQTD